MKNKILNYLNPFRIWRELKTGLKNAHLIGLRRLAEDLDEIKKYRKVKK